MVFGARLALVVFVVVAVAACARGAPENLRRHERSPPANGPELCSERSPCGWAVYTPYTREVEYFMKNVCTCPEGRDCVMDSDDLSTKAYVYRCKVPNS